jgi:hypothetical protein
MNSPYASGTTNEVAQESSLSDPEYTKQAESRQTRPALCFAILCVAAFLNLALAFLHARGLPVSNGLVTAAQIIVTMLALPAFLSSRAWPTPITAFALGFILFCTICTNLINPFDPKTVYDSLIIPVYIALGACAGTVKPRWMHLLLVTVLAISLIEMLFPSLYLSLFDPVGYLSATRGWLEGLGEKAGSGEKALDWASRAGGSKLGLSDRRIGGPFLEPLSLGYFAALMAIYYAGVHRGSLTAKLGAIIICLFLTLLADSRVPTILVVATSLFLLPRLKLPIVILWMTFPALLGITYLIYIMQADTLYGDTMYRLSATFDVLHKSSISGLAVGSISLARAGDSGIIYVIRCLGPIGLLIAIWYYSGVFTRRGRTNVGFFVAIAVYLSITLMFGGATLSIKTASLLGYLVGIAGLGQQRSRSGY